MDPSTFTKQTNRFEMVHQLHRKVHPIESGRSRNKRTCRRVDQFVVVFCLTNQWVRLPKGVLSALLSQWAG